MEKGLSKPLPFLVSLSVVEGIWRGVNFVAQEQVLDEFMAYFDTVAPLAFGLQDDVTKGKMNEVLTKIKAHYLDTNLETNAETKKAKVN